jgi:hypothetical protein
MRSALRDIFFTGIILCALQACDSNARNTEEHIDTALNKKTYHAIRSFDSGIQTIHVFVALCDNKYQGIVPVPPKIGNGQDPENNLYWGCSLGIRSYFKKSSEWTLVRTEKKDSVILQRLVFKHRKKNVYLVADAYDGRYIKTCTKDFLNSSAGISGDTITVGGKSPGIAGNAKLSAYIGHDGLMDFDLQETVENTDKKKRDVIILACYSKKYFTRPLQKANVNPLVWTTGLMAPEAYTLHDALTGYLDNETDESIRTRAAKAYSKYQKCSEKAARNLLVTGW